MQVLCSLPFSNMIMSELVCHRICWITILLCPTWAVVASRLWTWTGMQDLKWLVAIRIWSVWPNRRHLLPSVHWVSSLPDPNQTRPMSYNVEQVLSTYSGFECITYLDSKSVHVLGTISIEWHATSGAMKYSVDDRPGIIGCSRIVSGAGQFGLSNESD